jgi:hypothetical protein
MWAPPTAALPAGAKLAIAATNVRVVALGSTTVVPPWPSLETVNVLVV